ncbi:hypothetical protein [Paraburkholderia sp.]|nr:hypothetical protein [Paraburkholderia sp.]HZZ03292.1 hypothetical protein [Paraburkholderia sp.]
MRISKGNNVKNSNSGKRTMMLTQGFDCDQRMWPDLVPMSQ